MPERITRIIGEFMTAARESTDAKPGASLDDLAGHVLSELDQFFLDDIVSFTVLGNILLFNDFIRVTEKSETIQAYIRQLKEKGIKKFTVTRGVTQGELSEFIRALASLDRIPQPTSNIALDLLRSAAPEEATVEGSTLVTQVEKKLDPHFQEINWDGLLDLSLFDEAVTTLVSVVERKPDVFKLLVPYEGATRPGAAHGINVALLSVLQTASLGLEPQLVHDIGLSGLLHDVGAALVPEDVWSQTGELSEEQHDGLRRHTVAGAMYLAEHRNPPGLAMIAAFEHHMKYDGTGYPETKRRGQQQNLVSQIIAIADFCDALLHGSPRRKALNLPEIVGLLRELSGRDFNPVLVSSFVGRMKTIRAL